MTQLRILALVGSVHKNSINRKLFGFVKDAADDEVEFDLFDVATLPFYSADTEDNPSAALVDLKARIAKADGVLFVTPEYNRSVPAPLKNALDGASRPWGQNSWDGKPAGIMGASTGTLGTFGAQAHLRNILAFLNMPALPQPEFYFNFSANVDDRGELNETSKGFIVKYLEKFKAWVRAHPSR
jgi:chromate reductase